MEKQAKEGKKREKELEQEVNELKQKETECKNVLKRKWMEIEKQVRNSLDTEKEETRLNRDDNNNRKNNNIETNSTDKIDKIDTKETENKERAGREEGEIETEMDEDVEMGEWVKAVKWKKGNQESRETEHNYHRTETTKKKGGQQQAQSWKKEESIRQGQETKRARMETESRLWLFGDSQVNWVTQDGGLVTSAYLNQWEVRMKRGVQNVGIKFNKIG